MPYAYVEVRMESCSETIQVNRPLQIQSRRHSVVSQCVFESLISLVTHIFVHGNSFVRTTMQAKIVAISVVLWIEDVVERFEYDVFLPRHPHILVFDDHRAENSSDTCHFVYSCVHFGVRIPLHTGIRVNISDCTKFSEIIDVTKARPG